MSRKREVLQIIIDLLGFIIVGAMFVLAWIML